MSEFPEDVLFVARSLVWPQYLGNEATVERIIIGDCDSWPLVITAAKAIMAERDRTEAILKDPAAVRVNYLRGGIACQPLIDEAVASEREACAQEMDRRWRENANTPETRAAYSNAAAAIRNRP